MGISAVLLTFLIKGRDNGNPPPDIIASTPLSIAALTDAS
jgi:hypothetical protein